ncbi:ABC transporter permease [Microbacterium sp. Marseille-Q6648]|uniref:ABC transporter permease n=1 Tax=Microbacterium sp. Marseille-Q6648 TaxID=2937991 RepID=UPI00203FE664|nr:ABC transporter permease [Microbacterium sp. Marseille-Q6648]
MADGIAALPGTQPSTRGRAITRYLGRHLVEILFLVVVLLGYIASPNFLTEFNVYGLLQQASVLGLLALGQAVVIISGGFDLAVGSVLALSTMVTAVTISDLGLLSVPVAIGAGAAMGAISGIAVTWGRIPPFVATLAVLGIARGLAFSIDNQGIIITDANLLALNATRFGPVPLSAVIWVLMVVLVAAMLRFTRTGTHLYAVGGDIDSARLAGVRVGWVRFKAFLLSGALAGLAGVLFAARSSSGSPGIAVGWELDTIAIVVIGGVSLFGGSGSVVRVALGALIYLMLTNIMNLVNVDTYAQNVLKAILILAAVTIPLMVKNRGARRGSA